MVIIGTIEDPFTYTSNDMELRAFPLRVYIFDINGTLDCSANPEGKFVLPTKQVFDRLRSEGAWVGTWSGMYNWMQLQHMADKGIVPDFIMQKHEAGLFMESVSIIYKRLFDVEVIVVGDEDEDRIAAESYGFKYMTPEEFWNGN